VQTSVLITATNVTELTSDSFYKFVGPDATERQRAFFSRTQPHTRLTAVGNAPPISAAVSLHHALTDENFIDAILASAAVPGAFQPIAVKRAETGDTNLYVDGGVANNTPVSLAVTAGAYDITVLMANASDERPAPPTNLAALLQASNQIMQRRLLEGDTLLSLAQNLLGRMHDWGGLNAPMRDYLESLHRKDWRPITLRLIRPRAPLELTVMGFNDQAGINAAFDQGYADAQDEWVYTIG
jgi:predicted acylesterase/phospholipase RssA